MNSKTADLFKMMIALTFNVITILGLVSKGLAMFAQFLENMRTINNPPE